MDSTPPLFVRINRKTHGPLLAHDLARLFHEGLITRTTEGAISNDGPWLPLESFESAATVLTAPGRAFERVNTSGAPIVLADLIAHANRRPNNPAPPAMRPAVPSAPHDIPSLLRFNLAVEDRHGLLKLRPMSLRRSKRRSDYWLLLSLIAVVISVVLLAESFIAVQLHVLAARMPDQFRPLLNEVLFHSPLFAWGLAAFAFYAISLGWVMFFVMEDY